MDAFRFRSAMTAGAAACCLIPLAGGCGKTASDNGAVTATVAPVGTTKTTSTTAKPGSNCGAWPKSVLSLPQASQTVDKAGYFIWQDAFGWHLRVRALTPQALAYSGSFTASGDMGKVTPVPPDAGPAVTTELHGNQLAFTVQGNGDLRGFDLVAGCNIDQMTVDLKAAGQAANTDSIYLGATSKATASSFTLQRAAAAPK